MNPITPEMSGGMRKLAVTQVTDLLPRPWASVDIADPMWKVVESMKAKGRGAILVEEEGKLVGIFTERDLVSRLDHAAAVRLATHCLTLGSATEVSEAITAVRF